MSQEFKDENVPSHQTEPDFSALVQKIQNQLNSIEKKLDMLLNQPRPVARDNQFSKHRGFDRGNRRFGRERHFEAGDQGRNFGREQHQETGDRSRHKRFEGRQEEFAPHQDRGFRKKKPFFFKGRDRERGNR